MNKMISKITKIQKIGVKGEKKKRIERSSKSNAILPWTFAVIKRLPSHSPQRWRRGFVHFQTN
jgi:hypothetical protein